jgi:hypothetical protein
MARPRALYVETLIRSSAEGLWHATQEPHQHQRWDLRFTEIDYLPQTDPAGPRRFRYAVRVLPGLSVSGVGICAGERIKPDGTRTSALRFAFSDPLSLIRSGSGYWRYVPTADGIRFLTGYDYQPGWGPFGPLADRFLRPLMGWATAWSFDRLRLWLEEGVSPQRLLRLAVLEAAVRIGACAGAWWVLPASAAVLITAVAGLVPPLPSTPSARRCLRHPPDRLCATAPEPCQLLSDQARAKAQP